MCELSCLWSQSMVTGCSPSSDDILLCMCGSLSVTASVFSQGVFDLCVGRAHEGPRLPLPQVFSGQKVTFHKLLFGTRPRNFDLVSHARMSGWISPLNNPILSWNSSTHWGGWSHLILSLCVWHIVCVCVCVCTYVQASAHHSKCWLRGQVQHAGQYCGDVPGGLISYVTYVFYWVFPGPPRDLFYPGTTCKKTDLPCYLHMYGSYANNIKLPSCWH